MATPAPTSNDPNTWKEMCVRLFTTWPVRTVLIILVFITMLVAATLIVSYRVVSIGPITFVHETKGPSTPEAIQKIPSAFANFGTRWPNSNMGGDWQIFNDNKYLGHSSVWYETVPNPDHRGDFMLRVHYTLERGSRYLADEAFTGIFIDFYPPQGSADLSHFSGVTFKIGHIESQQLQRVRFYVNLANPDIKNYAYHEFEFTGLLQKDGGVVSINVPFLQLRQPEWSNDRTRNFDARNVYRISFFVRGDNASGYFDLDDVEFTEIAAQ